MEGRRSCAVALLSVLLFSSSAILVPAEDVVVGLLALGDVQTTSQSEEVDVFSRLMYHAAQLALQAVNNPNSNNGSLQAPVNGVANGSFVLQLPPTPGPSAQEIAAGANYLVGDGNASVVLGPFRVEEHDSVGFLVTILGVPLVTLAYSDAVQPFLERLDRVAGTAVRSWVEGTQVQLALQAVLQQYEWTEVALVVGTDPTWGTLVTELALRLDVQGINYTQFELAEGMSPESQLTQIKACCRIVLFLCGASISNTTGVMDSVQWWSSVREFLLAASSVGMTDGDYVFLSAVLTPLGAPDLVEVFGAEGAVGGVLHDAFRSLLVLAVDEHDGGASTESFIHEVERRAYGAGNLQAVYKQNLYATAMLHDAIWMYAAAAEMAIAAGDNVLNAESYTPSVNFTGLTGPILLDADRQRVPHFRVLGLEQNSSSFSLVVHLNPNSVTLSNFTTEPQPFVWANGLMTPSPAIPLCGFLNELCPIPSGPSVIAIVLPIVLLILAILAVILVIAILFCKRSQYNRELHAMPWNIPIEDINFPENNPLHTSSDGRKSNLSVDAPHRSSMMGWIAGQNTKRSNGSVSMESQLGLGFFSNIQAQLQSQNVLLEPVFKRNLPLVKEQLVELKQMYDLSSRYFAKFIGIAMDTHIVYIIREEYPMGSLHQVLHDPRKKLDSSFQCSFALDVIKGLDAIHSCFLGSHGNLTTTECYVDNHWVVHVSGMGLSLLKSNQYCFREPNGEDLFWTAPEVLRNKSRQRKGTPAGDLYSYAMILVEIFTRRKLYSEQNKDPHSIVQQLRVGTYPVLRPQISVDDCNMSWLEAVEACWNEIPSQRPTAAAVKKTVKKLSKLRKGNIADHLVGLMEKYAFHLEEAVEEQTLCLAIEKEKTEILLYRLLPRQVANQLKQGESVAAEHFPLVTVYFSDIVGFTSICSQSTPMQVVDMLKQLYTMYDNIIAQYNIYKVETIGDAYMLVSGLPLPNGTRHAVEICDAALDILHTTNQYSVPHLPGTQIKVRIGIHSGPCVAGVVGHTMPRYCLFGDTIVLASKMESSGKAQMIQISEATKGLLDIYGEYNSSLRGVSEFKGQTIVTTYWLEGKKAEVYPMYHSQPDVDMNQVVDRLTPPGDVDIRCISRADPIGDSTPTSPHSSLPGAIEEPSPIKFPPIKVSISLTTTPCDPEHHILHT